MGDGTVKYVAELAAESFKRQVDLDESVWRSLPFIAATFAFVAAVVGRAATDAPPIGASTYAIGANLLFVAAMLSLAWTLRWFWVVLRRREYEYPADDAAVRLYAEDMTAYHAALGEEGSNLDNKVVEEMRLFMVDQYGSAARTNLRLNAVRLEARSKVLLFILIGFVLAFLCEATIFVHRDLYGPSEVQSGQEPGRGPKPSDGQVGQRVFSHDGEGGQGWNVPVGGYRPLRGPSAADRAQNASSYRRRQHLGDSFQRQYTGEAVMAKGPPPRPSAGGAPPARPSPPPTQYVAKLNDGSKNQAPTPSPTPPQKK